MRSLPRPMKSSDGRIQGINMNYNPEKHHRRSIRLKGYDYTREGAYYFTICCHQRRCFLGEIKDGVMHLNLVGATVKAV